LEGFCNCVNSDCFGSYFEQQQGYCAEDIVVRRGIGRATHEMLCMRVARGERCEFDNRIPHAKKLRSRGCDGIEMCFLAAILGSQKIRQNFGALSSRRSPAADPVELSAEMQSESSNKEAKAVFDLKFCNAKEAGTHSWRKFLTAVRTRWLG
jgi:hypothetical protein